MKKYLFILMLFAVFIRSFAAQGQEPQPTFDPFANGSFYTAEPAEEPGDSVRPLDDDGSEMVLIPEGAFIMGSDDENALTGSGPAHEVSLKAFWIDRYEVTNAQYAKCVETKYCTPPQDLSSAQHPDYFENEAFSSFPVIHVDWYQAVAYCTWAGKRLPTEAEWEKAARGEEGFRYPWGNRLSREIPAQIGQFEKGDTVPVDSFPEGVSPYGVYNMEGNVWEWTADQYDPYYYSKSPDHDPLAVTGGNDYVIRGFSWAYPFSVYEITTRNSGYILKHTYDLGFRCAKNSEQ